jgi:hypothetical protein
MSYQFKYACLSEVELRGITAAGFFPVDVVYSRLTEMAEAGGGEGGRVFAFMVRRLSDNAILPLRVTQEPRMRPYPDKAEAMRMAWLLLLKADVEPPCFALGELIGAAETQALLYAITQLSHALPPGIAEAARAVLEAFGVHVPGSIADVVLGTLQGVHMKVTFDEGCQAIADAALAVKAKHIEAVNVASEGGATVTDAEKIGMAKAALKALVVDTIGNDIPNFDKIETAIELLVDLGVALINKPKPAAPPAA